MKNPRKNCIPHEQRDTQISPKLRFAILARDRFSCVYCGRNSQIVEIQVDHLIPVGKGGKSIPENLVAACKTCNYGKGCEELSEELWEELFDRIFINSRVGAKANEEK